MALSTWSYAWMAVAQRIPANTALKLAREAGVGIRRNDFLRLVGQARAAYGQRIPELDRPLNRKPTKAEITPITGGQIKGYRQYVDLFVRNKETGVVDVLHRTVHTSQPWSRQRAIDYLIDRERSKIAVTPPEGSPWGTLPNVEVVGGVYTATHAF